MKRKDLIKVSSVTLLFVLFFNVCVQAGTWSKTYSLRKHYGYFGDLLNLVHQCSDGGYLAVGRATPGVRGHQAWILKLTAGGRIQWKMKYCDRRFTEATSFQQAQGGGFIVSGYKGLRTKLWLLKISRGGEVRWRKVYGRVPRNHEHSFLQKTTDGGYILASTRRSDKDDYDIWVLKLGCRGGVKWQKTYGGSGIDYAASVQQTADGGYVVAGTTRSYGAGGSDIWILKLGTDGEVEWEKTWGGSEMDEAFSVRQTADGGYITVGARALNLGTDDGDAWVLKLKPDGAVEWQKTYGPHWGTSVVECGDGGFMVIGNEYIDFSNIGWLMKLGSDGTPEWKKEVGLSWRLSSIELTTDGGFVVGGYQNLWKLPSAGLAMKLDGSGEIENCSWLQPATPVVQDIDIAGADTEAEVTPLKRRPRKNNPVGRKTSAKVETICPEEGLSSSDCTCQRLP